MRVFCWAAFFVVLQFALHVEEYEADAVTSQLRQELESNRLLKLPGWSEIRHSQLVLV